MRADVLPRQAEDFYKTPPATTRALLTKERFSGAIHEPACGDGAIADVLRGAGHANLVCTDLIDRGYGVWGVDFLETTQRATFGGGMCDTLVTNPPFKLADEFALHALDLGYKHVAFLCRLAWLEGAARYKRLWSQHPPSRIWTFSPRQTLWRGDQENPGKGGTTAYAWFVWQDGVAGTQMGWLA
jgi:hypothetical protein